MRSFFSLGSPLALSVFVVIGACWAEDAPTPAPAPSKPGIVYRNTPAAPTRSVNEVLKDLKRWSAASLPKTDPVAPLTIHAVPELVVRDPSSPNASSYRALFELRSKEGKVAEPSFGFRLDGSPDVGEVTKKRLRRAIERIIEGVPSPDLFLDEKNTLYFEDKKVDLVFGFVAEGEDTPQAFPVAEKPALIKQFLDHYLKITLPAQEEDLTTVPFAGFQGEDADHRKFYFGIKYANAQGFASEAAEMAVQKDIARMLVGEDAPGLTVDAKSGVVSSGGTELRIRFYYLAKDKVAPVPTATQHELLDRLRRQAKWILAIKRTEENTRLELLAQGIKHFESAEAALAKVNPDKARRRTEITTALDNLEKAETTLERYGKRADAITAKQTRIPILRNQLDQALDLITYPIVVQTSAACSSFEVRQEGRSQWTLTLLNAGARSVVGVYSEKPEWVACEGGKAVVFAKWKQIPEPKLVLAAQIELDAQASQFDADSFKRAGKPLLYYYMGNSLRMVREAAEDAPFTAAKFVKIGAGLSGVRVVAEANPYHQYEFSIDGTLFRTRLVVAGVPADSAYSFFLDDDNSVLVMQNLDGKEQPRATLRGLDLKTIASASQSVVFKASSVTALEGTELEGAAQETQENRVYLLNQGKLIVVAKDEPDKTYASVVYDAASKKFQLRVEGDKASFQEIALDGPLLRRRLNLGAECDHKYRVVVQEDGTTSLFQVDEDGSEKAIAHVSGVTLGACAGESIALVLHTLSSIGEAVDWTGPLTKPSSTAATLKAGQDPQTLVTLVGNRITGAFPVPAGLTIASVDPNAEKGGISVSLASKTHALALRLEESGAWADCEWLGSLRDSQHAALITQGERRSGFIFHRGALLGHVDNVVSASALKDSASLVADAVSLENPPPEAAPLRRTPFSDLAVSADNLSGHRLLYNFVGNHLDSVEHALGSDREEAIESVHLFEKADKGIFRWIGFSNNTDYSVILDRDGTRIDPRGPLAQKVAFDWQSGTKSPERVVPKP